MSEFGRHFSREYKVRIAYSVCPKCGDKKVGWYRKCIKCDLKMENKSKDFDINKLIT
jgi:hypothetical protein